jgi:NADH dehydrogenase FAD-containing subunit
MGWDCYRYQWNVTQGVISASHPPQKKRHAPEMATSPAASQAPTTYGPSHGYQPRQLLLLGAGPAHLQVLTNLATHPLVGVRITLIAPSPRYVYPPRLTEFVTGRRHLDDCSIALEPLVRRSGVRWLQRNVQGLDAKAQTIQLDDGSIHHYDWLSVDSNPVQSRDVMENLLSGAREHALFAYPLENFAALWPRVAELGATQDLRIAILGGNNRAAELAFAVQTRLPQAAVSLLTAEVGAGAHGMAPLAPTVLSALKARQITVLPDWGTSLNAEHLKLRCGASLACDVVVMASSAHPPAWLASSGLALDERGFIAVTDTHQSPSHPHVFACGAVSARVDSRPDQRGHSHPQDGPALARNLAATIAAQDLHAHPAANFERQWIACADGSAILLWGERSAQSRLLGWFKRWRDRRFLARYRFE